MSIFAYRVFAAVVEQKSFAAAARQLHMTPSAVSHSISTLEGKMGVGLFQRAREGARLTREGEEILCQVLDVLNAEERLSQSLGHFWTATGWR